MTQGRMAASPDSKRKMITIGAFVVVIGVIVWQMMGLFGGDAPPPPAAPKAAPPSQMGAQAPGAPGATPPGMTAPAQPEAPKAAVLSEREQELLRLQQMTEAKYLAAINELQMLKIEKEIAQTSKDIATAKFDTLNAQKSIVELLSPPVPVQNYAGALTNPATTGEPGAPQQQAPMSIQPEITYSVISVTQLQSRWNAVLGNKGTLYQVSVGDVIPADNSKVISIDKAGVVLEKDGTQKRISLVPII